MKRKALISVMLISAMLIIAGMGTYAWWTSEVKAGFEVKTGKFDLGIKGEGNKFVKEINLYNGSELLYPGKEIGLDPFTIENTGDFPMKLSVELKTEGGGSLKDHISISGLAKNDGGKLGSFEKPLTEVQDSMNTALDKFELGYGKAIDFKDIKIKLDGDTVGNRHQGRNLKVTLKVTGKQTNAPK